MIKNLMLTLTITSLLQGCASQVSDLSKDLNPTLSPGQNTVPNSTIKIRYPMVATDAAKQALKSNYTCKYNNYIGHPLSGCGNPGFTDEYALTVFERSTYYATELKKILERYGMSGHVFLEPLLVDFQNNEYILKPAQTTRIENSASVDLYAFEQAVKSAIGFGYSPDVAIRVATSKSPKTCGYVLIMPSHLPIEKSSNCSLSTDSIEHFNPLNFFRDAEIEEDSLPRHENGGITINSILGVGDLWEENNEAYLKSTADDNYIATSDSIKNETSDWIARMAITAISKSSSAASKSDPLFDYINFYDTSLASKLKSGKKISDTEEKNLQIAKKLMDVETMWLAAQSDAIGNGLLNGDFGNSFRKSRVIMADGYNKAQTLGWMNVGATLVSGYSSGLFGGAGSFNPTALMAMHLRNQQMYTDASNRLGDALIEALAPSIEMRNLVLNFTFEGINENVSAGSYGELKEKLKILYSKFSK